MIRRLLSVVPPALLAVAVLAARPAAACPCLPGPVGSNADEVAQRVMLVVNADSIDYLLQLSIVGDATDLGWLIPTPAVPDDPRLVDPDFFDDINSPTRPLLWPCDMGGGGGGGGGCGGGLRAGGGPLGPDGTVDVWSEGRIGQLDFAVLSATDGSDLVTWLDTHGYTVDATIQAVIDAYLADGFSFVALRVAGDALADPQPTLGPIQVHVPGTTEAVVPLRMASLSGSERLSMQVFVVADEQMVPTNYPLLDMSNAALAEDPETGSNYNDEIARLVAAEGPGFVLERSNPVQASTWETPGLFDLIDDRWLVRLHTEIAPAGLTEDLRLERRSERIEPSFPCVDAGSGGGADEGGGCAVARPGSTVLSLVPLLVVVGIFAVRLRRG